MAIINMLTITSKSSDLNVPYRKNTFSYQIISITINSE